MFASALSTRLSGATRHVPQSRIGTAVPVVATKCSARRLCREKESLGWHECALLVCYTRIAHSLTQLLCAAGSGTDPHSPRAAAAAASRTLRWQPSEERDPCRHAAAAASGGGTGGSEQLSLLSTQCACVVARDHEQLRLSGRQSHVRAARAACTHSDRTRN